MSRATAGYRRMKKYRPLQPPPLDLRQGENLNIIRGIQEGHRTRSSKVVEEWHPMEAEESWFFVPNAKLIWTWKRKRSTRARLSLAPSVARTSKWRPPVRWS